MARGQKRAGIWALRQSQQARSQLHALEVTVSGDPDPGHLPGFVVDLKWLKDVMEQQVLSAFDHRHLNLEVPEFESTIPTTENIAIAAWRRLPSQRWQCRSAPA